VKGKEKIYKKERYIPSAPYLIQQIHVLREIVLTLINGKTLEKAFEEVMDIRDIHTFIWYNPRNGEEHIQSVDSQELIKVIPPTAGRGQDWVLIIKYSNTAGV
jgi:hypothetical protein